MDFKKGDRVQTIDRDNLLKEGTVKEILPALKTIDQSYWSNYSKLSSKERKEYKAHAKVNWDNGTKSTIDVELLSEIDSELERQFRNTSGEANDKIEKHLKEASDALQKACEVAEEYGVPFYSGVSFLSQSYTPASLEEKFRDLDRNFIEDITGASTDEYGGWQHSQVCY